MDSCYEKSITPYKYQPYAAAEAVIIHVVSKLRMSTICLIRADAFLMQYESI